MRRALGILLLLGLAFGEGKFGGRITGGKARKLLEKGLPLLKRADKIYKDRYVLEQGTGDEREAELRKAIALYDKGTEILQEALEIQEDPGVNWRLTLAARNLARSRAWVLRRENARRRKANPPPPPPKTNEPKTNEPKPNEPKPNEPKPNEPRPEPKPEPVKPKPPPPPEEEPVPTASFSQGDPPALLVDAKLTPPEFVPESKTALSAIKKRITTYYQSLRPNKLRYRHRLCSGKGMFSDGAICNECCGTGVGINLHHFRRVYWTSYSPLLRSATGALDALEAYYARALRKPAMLGPVVKSCKVAAIDYQGDWARATVELTTDEGKEERHLTLVSIGNNWFFYSPATDAELLE